MCLCSYSAPDPGILIQAINRALVGVSGVLFFPAAIKPIFNQPLYPLDAPSPLSDPHC